MIELIVSTAHEVVQALPLASRRYECRRCGFSGSLIEIFSDENECTPHYERPSSGWKHNQKFNKVTCNGLALQRETKVSSPISAPEAGSEEVTDDRGVTERVATHVICSFGIPKIGVVKERYRLDEVGDLQAWEANSSAYPQLGIEIGYEVLTAEQGRLFNLRRLEAKRAAAVAKLNLRKGIDDDSNKSDGKTKASPSIPPSEARSKRGPRTERRQGARYGEDAAIRSP